MIERFRLWLRAWLGFNAMRDEIGLLDRTIVGNDQYLQSRIHDLEQEIAQLKVDHYTPPQQKEPERKVIVTRTMREFNAILDSEFEKEERNAVR